MTFAQLKDAAGNAGLEIDRLAHLQQKSLPERGASKGELLDEIGRLFVARPESDRIEILEVFTRGCLRNYPDREGELGNAFRRSGIILKPDGNLFVFALEESKSDPNAAHQSTDQPNLEILTAAPVPLIFVSYSHTDSTFKDQLSKHLKALAFQGKLSFWTDDQINPGTAWFHEIKQAIQTAAVAVLLVTKDFLASDFIREHEMKPILQRHTSGRLKVCWVPVRACNWDETELKDIQAVISPSKPLAEMKAERDRSWVEVCRKIKQAALI